MKLPPPYKAPSEDSENEEEYAFTNREFLLHYLQWMKNLLNCGLMNVVNYQIQCSGFLENVHEPIMLKEKISISLAIVTLFS